MKIGRNQPCHCGSGKKFKHCHGSFKQPAQPASHQFVAQALRRHHADETIRQAQQGLGRPIISLKAHDHRIVAVGKKVFSSNAWKTVPDFLNDYIKTTLGPEWGNAEINKPLAERHPIMQWYDAYCRYQAKFIKNPDEVINSEITGVVSCYLGLAYSLYLIAHNLELQARMVSRLLDPTQFQGAYYELIVANTLIRAGFSLALEDEIVGIVTNRSGRGVTKNDQRACDVVEVTKFSNTESPLIVFCAHVGHRWSGWSRRPRPR